MRLAGSTVPVAVVTWLTNGTRVRGVSAASMRSRISSALRGGFGSSIFFTTIPWRFWCKGHDWFCHRPGVQGQFTASVHAGAGYLLPTYNAAVPLTRRHLLRSLLPLVLALPFGAAQAQRAISMKDAVERVERETRGKVLSAESMGSGRNRQYRIKVLTPNGRVRVILVPAAGG